MIETERLLLRGWREADLAPFHAMGQDAEAMRYLGPPTSRDETRWTLNRAQACQAEHGHCQWAIERKSDGAFLGYCGLKPGDAPMRGEIEIGWQIDRRVWGRGYAREAAAASIAWGWRNLAVPSIAAVTVPANRRSWGLMERLGMVRFPEEDFRYPDLTPGEPPRAHILYRITRPGLWRRAA